MNLAWATCLGYGDSKDLDKCYKLVDHEQLTAQNIPLTSRAKSMLNNAIVDILINNDGRLNNSELQRFRALLAKQLEVKLATASINEKTCYDKTVRIEDNMIIEEGDKIELCFRFEGSAFSKKLDHKTALLTRMVANDVNNNPKVKQYHFMTGEDKSMRYFMYTFRKRDLFKRKWTIEFYDILGNLVFEKAFNVTTKEQ